MLVRSAYSGVLTDVGGVVTDVGGVGADGPPWWWVVDVDAEGLS